MQRFISTWSKKITSRARRGNVRLSRMTVFNTVAPLEQQPHRKGRRKVEVALNDGVHRVDHLGYRAALQNVAPRTRQQRRHDIMLAFGECQHHGPYVWIITGNAGGRFNAASWHA